MCVCIHTTRPEPPSSLLIYKHTYTCVYTYIQPAPNPPRLSSAVAPLSCAIRCSRSIASKCLNVIFVVKCRIKREHEIVVNIEGAP